MQQTDVVIVGGGPAGSTCAWKLRQSGFDVIVLDRSAFPRTKLCAGWITPQVVHDLELDIESYPNSFMTFDHLAFNWKFIHLRKKTTQHSIRRYEFDDYLLHRSGAEVITHKVRDIQQRDNGFVVDDRYRCRYLVGAGGTACPVYRHIFHALNPRPKYLQIATYEQEFAYEWRDGQCHLWFFDRGLPGYAWYVPKANGHINIGLGGNADVLKSKSLRLQDHWEKFVSKLERRKLVSGVTLNPSGYSYFLRGPVDCVRSGNAFIVGDAVGLATTDMGEGIGPAVQSGIRAASAIAGNGSYDLSDLEQFSIPNPLVNRLLSFSGQP